MILRLTFDWIWIKKFKGMTSKVKIVATGIPMLIIAVSSILMIKMEWYQYLVSWVIISTLWSFIFDLCHNLLFKHTWNYLSEETWPDRFILKYFNNWYLYTFFRIVLVGFLWGMINNVSLKTKKR